MARKKQRNRSLNVKNDKMQNMKTSKENSNGLVIRMYKTNCIVMSEKTQQCANSIKIVSMCGSGDTRSTVLKKYKMVQGNKEKREQSLRMMNVSYAGISNITYVKQQQQDDQMRPSSMKTRIEYSLLTWLGQAKTMWTQTMQRRYKNTQ